MYLAKHRYEKEQKIPEMKTVPINVFHGEFLKNVIRFVNIFRYIWLHFLFFTFILF